MKLCQYCGVVEVSGRATFCESCHAARNRERCRARYQRVRIPENLRPPCGRMGAGPVEDEEHRAWRKREELVSLGGPVSNYTSCLASELWQGMDLRPGARGGMPLRIPSARRGFIFPTEIEWR